MRALPAAVTLTLTAAAAATGCARAAPCNGVSCVAECPRDAARDPAGRCACADGDVPLLGACVPPPVGEAFCGPAASLATGSAASGCVFRACGAGQSLDVVSGACVPRASLARGDGGGAMRCQAPAVPIVEAGRLVCASAGAACPRGTTPATDSPVSDGPRACERPPACPPGSLADGASCRPVVTSGGRGGTRVDVGAWAALALGIHGGPGSAALCQPLAQRPGLFGGLPLAHEANGANAADGGAAPGRRTVRVAMAILLPDQDVSRVHADVRSRDASGHPLSAVAETLVSGSVGTLLEALRGLGGEASAASVELEVTCAVGEAGAGAIASGP
jgi:hypothetical protein